MRAAHQIIANGNWHEESDEEKDEDDEEINVAPEGKAVESVVDSRQIAAENGGRDARQIQPQPLLRFHNKTRASMTLRIRVTKASFCCGSHLSFILFKIMFVVGPGSIFLCFEVYSVESVVCSYVLFFQIFFCNQLNLRLKVLTRFLLKTGP